MDKKGMKSGMWIVIALVVVVVAIMGFTAWKMFSEDTTEVAITGAAATAKTETGTKVISAKVGCPSDGTTDGQIRYEDTLASAFTQGNPTCYFVPQTEGLERVTAGTMSTSDYSTAVDLKCTTSGTEWKTVCVSSSGSWTSVEEAETFTADGAFVKRDVQGKAADELRFKVEDKVTGSATYFNISNCGNRAGLAGTTGYEGMNGSQCVVADAHGNSALTLAADDYIDATIYLKTNTTKKTFGEDGLRTFMLVNADPAELDEPLVGRDGVSISDIGTASLMTEDQRKYSGYEYVYSVGNFGSRESEIDYYQQTAAGVNPSTDPVIDFCAEGRYDSTKQKDTILVGCWSDAVTQVQVVTADLQQFKFDIS